jgi:hypothetical protein
MAQNDVLRQRSANAWSDYYAGQHEDQWADVGQTEGYWSETRQPAAGQWEEDYDEDWPDEDLDLDEEFPTGYADEEHYGTNDLDLD